MNTLIIAVSLLMAAYLSFSKRLSHSSSWRATVTPLASIMGSGFLVSAPLLAGLVGYWAVFCMGLLLVLAYAVGEAIRFNIRYFEPIEHQHGTAQSIAFLSRIVLAVAYFISVTYYLQLLAAFLLKSLSIDQPQLAPMITTVLLLVIGGVGIWKGMRLLEKLEKYAIALNLGMIAALLVALAVYNVQLWYGGKWSLPDIASEIDLSDLRVLLGLLIVVQGFETSRYLGSEHPADVRITTMRRAQLISGLIYLTFISLATVLFHDGLGADVTAILQMTAPAAVLLPIMLTVAAIGSQFSAAVADNEGAGGLIFELTNKRVSIRHSYFFILIVTLVLTWQTNVNEIISYASRAFALFYMLQCIVAFIVTINNHEIPSRHFKLWGFGIVSLLCLLVFTFGIPSE